MQTVTPTNSFSLWGVMSSNNIKNEFIVYQDQLSVYFSLQKNFYGHKLQLCTQLKALVSLQDTFIPNLNLQHSTYISNEIIFIFPCVEIHLLRKNTLNAIQYFESFRQ